MDCNSTSTKRGEAGALLADYLVAVGLGGLVVLILALLVMFGGRSFMAMANYVALDQNSRQTLDKMTKEIRQCLQLTSAGTNYLTFQDYDGGTLSYTYNSTAGTLSRSKNGVQDSKSLLTGCNYLQFSIFQRNPVGGTYDQYPTAVATNCKVVQMTWVCSRQILGGQNTESVQSAKVVIRKE
jgi:hypothetical protein